MAGAAVLRRPGRALGLAWLGLLLAPFAAVLLALGALLGSPGPEPGAGTLRYGASAFALRDIPPRYLRLYQDAAQNYGLDWAILAGIGSIETNHGRLKAPGVLSGVNSYGCCGGPMQFWIAPPHPNTWDGYGVDGNGDARRDPYDPADAIPAAARYLKALGAPGDYRRAIFGYNHADWYVDDVLSMADRYRGPLLEPAASAPVTGARAKLDANGVAHAPRSAPGSVKRMIAAGNRIGDRPYVYGGGHPDFLHAWGLDCSSSTSYILNGGDAFGTSSYVSGDFETWGEPGPGRWVTIYANAGHVWTRIAGLRNDTGRYDTGPNGGESGPRWRLGSRPETGFVVRHPRGL